MTALSQAGKASLQKTVDRFMRHYADPRETQRKLLEAMVARNAGTAFGREHGFRKIASVADYQRQVPVRSWPEISPYVDRIVTRRAQCSDARCAVLFPAHHRYQRQAKDDSLHPALPGHIQAYPRHVDLQNAAG